MKHIKTRIFSFIALAGMIGGCGELGREGYYVATDSFIAPAMLSPQNDLVLEAKLKLSSLLLEKVRPNPLWRKLMLILKQVKKL